VRARTPPEDNRALLRIRYLRLYAAGPVAVPVAEHSDREDDPLEDRSQVAAIALQGRSATPMTDDRRRAGPLPTGRRSTTLVATNRNPRLPRSCAPPVALSIYAPIRDIPSGPYVVLTGTRA